GAGGCGSGGGTAWSVAAVTSFLASCAVGSSTGLRSPTLSASGRAFAAFGALRAPAVSCEKSLAEMMSIGIVSIDWTAGGLAAKLSALQIRTAMCTAIDTTIATTKNTT